MNNFILNYNPFQTSPSETTLLGIFRISRHVASFYQPFIGTYILKSDETAYTLNEGFKGVFGDTSYMLTLITGQWASGSLPHEVWNWINHGVIPTIPPPPPPAKGIGMAVPRTALDALREYGNKG